MQGLWPPCTSLSRWLGRPNISSHGNISPITLRKKDELEPTNVIDLIRNQNRVVVQYMNVCQSVQMRVVSTGEFLVAGLQVITEAHGSNFCS